MIVRRISEMLNGLEIDIDFFQLPDTDFIDAEEIKVKVFQRISDLERSDKCEAPNS